MRTTTDDRDVWLAAIALVRRQGVDASTLAWKRADAAQRQGDPVTEQIWIWIAEAAEELLKPRPDGDEWMQ